MKFRWELGDSWSLLSNMLMLMNDDEYGILDSIAYPSTQDGDLMLLRLQESIDDFLGNLYAAS